MTVFRFSRTSWVLGPSIESTWYKHCLDRRIIFCQRLKDLFLFPLLPPLLFSHSWSLEAAHLLQPLFSLGSSLCRTLSLNHNQVQPLYCFFSHSAAETGIWAENIPRTRHLHYTVWPVSDASQGFYLTSTMWCVNGRNIKHILFYNPNLFTIITVLT